MRRFYNCFWELRVTQVCICQQYTTCEDEEQKVGLKQKMENNRELILEAWNDRSLLAQDSTVQAIENTVAKLDTGELRITHKSNSVHVSNQLLMKTICLYFGIPRNWEQSQPGPFTYNTHVPLKYRSKTTELPRLEPGCITRFGAYIAPSAVLMPSFINVGAYIDEGTMIDTWATIGSGAQIGKNTHISGGVGIGGILEPLQKSPVIIGDNCFIGSRCIITEGVCVNDGAILGQGVSINASIPIYKQVTEGEVEELPKGVIPTNSIAIPSTRLFDGGPLHTPCVLIIGERKEGENPRTALNPMLRKK